MMEKYRIDTGSNMEFVMQQAKDLLRFGKNFPSPGGSSYYLGDDKSPMKDRPRTKAKAFSPFIVLELISSALL